MAGYYAANQIHPIVETPSCLSDPRSYNKRCANVIFKIKVGNIYKLIRVLRVLRSSKGRLNLHSFNHIYNVESWILIKYDVCDVLNSFVCDNPWFFFQDALRIFYMATMLPLLLGIPSCAGFGPSGTKHNVLMIVVDDLRPQLKAYGEE